jgi:hypothetical protein
MFDDNVAKLSTATAANSSSAATSSPQSEALVYLKMINVFIVLLLFAAEENQYNHIFTSIYLDSAWQIQRVHHPSQLP